MAALLLVVLEDAEAAFWCLAAVLEYRLPTRYLQVAGPPRVTRHVRGRDTAAP